MIQTAQLVLALSILVVLHELGHFIPAKLFGMRVTKFYLFFDPYFSLFKFKKGGTEYGIGWLPLGGYVKISGMVDESMDKESMKLPPQPWEFRSKKPWQRLITMLGGIFVNIILALGIFSMIFYVWGQDFLPANKLTQGVYVDPVFREVGFQNGDKIFSMDGEKITDDKSLMDISWAVLTGEASQVTVLRKGKRETISIPEDMDARVMANKDIKLLMAPFPFVIDSVLPGGNAYLAGFKAKDRVIAINDTTTNSFYHAQEFLNSNKGKYVNATVDRNGQIITVKSYVSSQGMIGVRPAWQFGFLYETEHKSYGLSESVISGSTFALDLFVKKIGEFKLLFNRNSVKHVGSVLAMRKQFAPVWDWKRFWLLTANLSLVLAFFNLLPIPGLDGGHALMTLVEMITRRKPSQKFLEVTQSIGMILLLSLMVFAIGNDIFNGNL